MKNISLTTVQTFLRTNDFLLLLVKILKIKLLYPLRRPIIQNEKPQRAEKCYLQLAIMRIFPVASIQKQEKVIENSCDGVSF